MSAPTKHPDWATDATNNVEPPTGKIAAGWVPGEQPPSGWMNWWKNLVGQWTRWLEGEVGGLTTRMGSAEGDIDALQASFVDAALKSAVNVFAQAQIINVANGSPDWAILETTEGPGSHRDAGGTPDMPGNRWKLEYKFPTQGGAWAAIYVGQSPDAWALVTNARWLPGQPPAGKWRQIDNNYASMALIGQTLTRAGVAGGSRYYCSYKADHSSDWTDWPTDLGGDLMAGDSVSAAGEYRYHGNAHNNVTKAVDPLHFAGSAAVQVFGAYAELESLRVAAYALDVPEGGTLGQVRVKVEVVGTDGYVTVRLLNRKNINHAGGSPTAEIVAEYAGGPLAGGIHNISTQTDGSSALSFGGRGISKDENYTILIYNPGATKFWLLALDYAFNDPGPRNR